MKWFLKPRRAPLALAVVALLLSVLSAQADLPEWMRHLDSKDFLRSVFFRLGVLPSGQILYRRPPAATQQKLSALLKASPDDAHLYSLRALETEQLLDFQAAEADWKKYAELADDPLEAQLDLADFYHRQLRPQEEIAALIKVGKLPAPHSERFLPSSEQTPWLAFERILPLAEAQALPSSLTRQAYQQWITRYPKESSLYRRYFTFLVANQQIKIATELLTAYADDFPKDKTFPVQARASLEAARGSAAGALAIYEKAFQPQWPPELVSSYFDLLKKERRLRAYLDSAQAGIAREPGSLTAAARLFYYYQQQGNFAAARKALAELRLRKEASGSPWTAGELLSLAKLYEGIRNYNEAARYYYALYSLPSAPATAQEESLAGLLHLLLTAPEQRFQFGSGDFSLYQDIATMDPNPGFLNGILSLLLNSENPRGEYARREQAAVTYYHRASAAELLPLFDQKFPASAHRPGLHATLIETYSNYGESEAVIRNGRAFLANFTDATQRTHVAFLLADAYSRTKQLEEEFALYEVLLEELGAKSEHVPFGGELLSPPARRMAVESPRYNNRDSNRDQKNIRSPEYSRVLRRYIGRLTSLNRKTEALAVYRKEVARNPDDPGLYAELADFLEQNSLTQETEALYRQALKQFPGQSWYHRLARWYLLQRRTADFNALTRNVITMFTGSELETYFREVVSGSSLGTSLPLQLNLYAHKRFPHNLTFVRNLLGIYSRKQTRNPAAAESLLRQYWFYDNNLRNQFFALLSRANALDADLQNIRTTNKAIAMNRWDLLAQTNPGATQFLAEGTAWQAHFEQAAPLLGELAKTFPADADIGRRAADLHRSLVPFTPDYTEVAALIEGNLSRANPADSGALTRIGEIYAEREQFAQAQPFWDRIAQLRPGKPEGYRESATVFWDYYRFDDALRQLNEGRQKLNDPALFSYEVGAIYENRREMKRAIDEYVKGALAGDYPARSRLLRLSRRSSLRSGVDQATAQKIQGANPPFEAVQLRIDVLQELEQRGELEKLLQRLTESTTSLELLDQLDPIAGRLGFDAVHENSLQRRVALTKDPAERLRKQLSLARYYENKKEIATAREIVETLYRENPLLLGVVRALVDFYWRHDLHEPALEVLLQASTQAYPALKINYLFEAARKSNEAGQHGRARTLLNGLLENDPFNSGYLAAAAESYSREGNYQALRDFYQERINAVQETNWSLKVKTDQIANFRRGMIPALTRLGEHAEAVNQYIEILNRFPEDETLTANAASYALAQELESRLTQYYEKTIKESPQNYRWPMVLARLETHFENFPAAIAAYQHALEVSPDRTALREAQGRLEERLLRFDDAIQTYTQLYELTYNNPQWMEKVAELHARRNQFDNALAALRKALIEGRPEEASNYFAVAQRLENWGQLPPALEFTEKGLALTKGNLLNQGANLHRYTRLLVRLRDYETAYHLLLSARQQDNKPFPDSPLRYSLPSAFKAMGENVNLYYTPEEKLAFATFLEKQHARLPGSAVPYVLLPLAQYAGLADLEARWLVESLMSAPDSRESSEHYSRLIDLQSRRLRFNELGNQLKSYWRVHSNKGRKSSILDQAARIYRSAGNTDDEFRVLADEFNRSSLSQDLLERYFQLLLIRDPERLVTIAGSSNWTSARNTAVEFAIASGDRGLAQRAVTARSRNISPVWQRAYAGLAGLYLTDNSQTVNTDFRTALNVEPIGDRVGKATDRNQQLAGDIWFYYGSRYGEYLDVTARENSEDFLPALLEARPANIEDYLTLAAYYEEKGDATRALNEFEHALELNPNRAEVHHRIALLLWQQGEKEKATARWLTALQSYRQQMDRRTIEESFWPSIQTILEQIGVRGLLPPLRNEVDDLLKVYIRRNGVYRIEPLLRGALAATGNSAEGVAWLAALSNEAANPVEFLGNIVRADWIPAAHRAPLYKQLLQASQAQWEKAQGVARNNARNTLESWQIARVGYLLNTKQNQQAQAALDQLPESTRQRNADAIVPFTFRLAARSKQLAAVLATYRQDENKIPNIRTLQQAAAALRTEGYEDDARQILEFVYEREILHRRLTAANFLGLAEVRLQQNNPEEAFVLLRRMVLVVGEPFENHMPAAELLLKHNQQKEAERLLRERVLAVPWDLPARLRLAGVQVLSDRPKGTQALTQLAGSQMLPYETRVEAALKLQQAGAKNVSSGSQELDWLAGKNSGTDPAVRKPFQVRTRLHAAGESQDPAQRIQLLQEARALAPADNSSLLPLHRAARETKNYSLAVASIAPLLETRQFRYIWQNANAPSSQRSGQDQQTASLAEHFLTLDSLTPAERAETARDLAAAYRALDLLGPAELFLRISLELETQEPLRLRGEKQLEAVVRERRRRALNKERRPSVSQDLSQPATVRSRLSSLPTDTPVGDRP